MSSNRTRSAKAVPRRITRPQMTVDQMKRFIQQHGGMSRYARGPRKGQTKDAQSLRREVSRIRSCKYLDTRKVHESRERKQKRLQRELKRLQ